MRTLLEIKQRNEQRQSEKIKRAKWYKSFQKRSDELAADRTTDKGKCGGMAFCDFCPDCGEDNACVKAFRDYVKENNIVIDFDDMNMDKYF